MGCQWWRPSLSSVKARVETASGRTTTRPRSFPGMGAVRSSISTVSVVPSQWALLGPMRRLFASRESAPRRRSVIAHRLGEP